MRPTHFCGFSLRSTELSHQTQKKTKIIYDFNYYFDKIFNIVSNLEFFLCPFPYKMQDEGYKIINKLAPKFKFYKDFKSSTRAYRTLG